MKNSLLFQLEEEAIFYIRETSTRFDPLALLFSGGKDSSVLLHLVKKAFKPQKIPFCGFHIDTGFNFPEVEDFLKEVSARYQIDLKRFRVELSGESSGHDANRLQSFSLNKAIKGNKIRALFGGGRREEEAARAKEKFFSSRTDYEGWCPEKQVPEFFRILVESNHPTDHYRVFPLNNWREKDVWNYIDREAIALPNLYFAHERTQGDGKKTLVRCRTMGDRLTTTFFTSTARSPKEILSELDRLTDSERAGRKDDAFSVFSMEIRKKEGYF